jgi:hypothetical protein
MIRRSYWAWLGLAALTAGSLCGCATRETGYKITDETIAFIEPGTTTRSEVIDNLGPPLLELKDLRVLAYSWGKAHATGGGAVATQEAMQNRPIQSYAPVSTGGGEEGGLVESRRWVCCVAWDESERVRRVERIRLEGATSLEQAVRDWARSGR